MTEVSATASASSPPSSGPSKAPNGSAPTSTAHISVPPPSAPPEVEATITRLAQHKNVRAVMILDRAGVVIRSTGAMLQGQEGQVVLRRYAGEVKKLVDAVDGGVGRMEVDDDLRFLRVRTRQHELMITPDERFVLVVIQDPTK